MENLFIQYSRCSTCKKAEKWLKENNINFKKIEIIDETPTKENLTKWYKMSGFPLKKFFNTSGVLYKEMNLKDKLKDMSEDEMLELLASNGKLIKRPLLVNENLILIGFKEQEYEKLK